MSTQLHYTKMYTIFLFQISNAIFKRNSALAALAIFATNTKDAIFQNSSFYSNKSECDIVFNNCHAVSNLRMATCLMHNSCRNLAFAVRKEGRGVVSGRMWNNTFELGDRLITNQNKHGIKYRKASMDIIESYYASGTAYFSFRIIEFFRMEFYRIYRIYRVVEDYF